MIVAVVVGMIHHVNLVKTCLADVEILLFPSGAVGVV